MRPPWRWSGVAILWALAFACPVGSRFLPHGYRINRLGLGMVEQFERRAASVEHDDPPGLRTPVGKLLKSQRVSLERQRVAEILHRERDTQLGHIGHIYF